MMTTTTAVVSMTLLALIMVDEREVNRKKSTISSNNRYKRIRDTNHSAIEYESDLQKSVQDFVVEKGL